VISFGGANRRLGGFGSPRDYATFKFPPTPRHDLAHLALPIGASSAEDEVDRDLRPTKLGKLIVEGGASAVFDDAPQGVYLHLFAGLGILTAQQPQLAVHYLDQRAGTIEDAQRELALKVARQDHIIMRAPWQGERPHRPPLACADGGRAIAACDDAIALLREIADLEADDDGDVILGADEHGHNDLLPRITIFLATHNQ
jgi:hypothetical protein